MTLCRAAPHFVLDDGGAVSLAEACEVLARWDLHANVDSRGAHLFRQFLAEANQNRHVRQLPASFAVDVAFDESDPIATPRGLDTSHNSELLAILAKAVQSLEQAGIPLDAALGELQGVTRNGDWIPLHGGPEYEGIFNKIEARFQGAAGYPEVTKWSSSWILAVEFSEAGPRARGILSYSLSANPSSPHFADQTRMFSRKEWLELPFHEADVEAAALRKYRVRGPRSD
ncbi:MAG: penicillin acylase family protein [Deltaproteobacteria bacterium]|nr:penicillin acylase family protein [Deltaproteobacteria bacterium]